MEPPVLGGVLADEVLGGLYVFGCNPFGWVILVGPFGGHDEAWGFDFEKESIANPAAAGDSDWHIVFHRDQADAFIRARLATEEIDENALFPGILVCDKAEAGPRDGNGFHLVGCTFFVDYFLAGVSADTLKVVIDELVVEWSYDSVHIEVEKAQQIAHNLEVAVMTCHQKHALAALHQPLNRFDIFVCRVLVPVVALDKARCKEDIDDEHNDMLKGASAGLDEPLLVFIRETGSEVVESTLSASVIALPHTPAKKAGKTQVCFDTEPIHYKKCYPQRSIPKPIEHKIGLFLFPSFFGRLRHSR